MNRHDYKHCEFCERYTPAGDSGECHASLPEAGPYTWPRVSPAGFCEEGFRLNPSRLFDQIDRLDAKWTASEVRVAELEVEIDAMQEEIQRYSDLLGQSLVNRKRVELPTVSAEEPTTITGV